MGESHALPAEPYKDRRPKLAWLCRYVGHRWDKKGMPFQSMSINQDTKEVTEHARGTMHVCLRRDCQFNRYVTPDTIIVSSAKTVRF